MNTLPSVLSAAVLLMLSLNANANALSEADNTEPLPHQAETHQGHLEHDATAEAKQNPELNQPTTGQRLRNVTHPKTGHVVQRYVGQ